MCSRKKVWENIINTVQNFIFRNVLPFSDVSFEPNVVDLSSRTKLSYAMSFDDFSHYLYSVPVTIKLKDLTIESVSSITVSFVAVDWNKEKVYTFNKNQTSINQFTPNGTWSIKSISIATNISQTFQGSELQVT